jgi:hypothetical protein
LRLQSVGWLIAEDKDTKLIVPHLNLNTAKQQRCGDMVIPTSAIRKLTEKEAFRDAAELAGVPLSRWVRDRLRQVETREPRRASRPIPFAKP